MPGARAKWNMEGTWLHMSIIYCFIWVGKENRNVLQKKKNLTKEKNWIIDKTVFYRLLIFRNAFHFLKRK